LFSSRQARSPASLSPAGNATVHRGLRRAWRGRFAGRGFPPRVL